MSWGNGQRGGGSGVLGKGGSRDGQREESKTRNSTWKDGFRRSGSLKVDSGWGVCVCVCLCVCMLGGGSLIGMLQGSTPRSGDRSGGHRGRAGSCRRTSASLQDLLTGAGPLPPCTHRSWHGLLRARAWPQVGWLFSAKDNGSLSQPVGMVLWTLRRFGVGSRAPTWWVIKVSVLAPLWPQGPPPRLGTL